MLTLSIPPPHLNSTCTSCLWHWDCSPTWAAWPSKKKALWSSRIQVKRLEAAPHVNASQWSQQIVLWNWVFFPFTVIKIKCFLGFYLSKSRWRQQQRTTVSKWFLNFKSLCPRGQMSVGQGIVPAWHLNLCYLFLVNGGHGRSWASENWLRGSSLGSLLWAVDSDITGFRAGWSLVDFPVRCKAEQFSGPDFVCS